MKIAVIGGSGLIGSKVVRPREWRIPWRRRWSAPSA